MFKFLLEQTGLKVKNNILFDSKSKKIGFINPGVFISSQKQNLIFVGPLKTSFSSKKPKAVIKAMWSSGCLIRGSTNEIVYVLNKLRQARYSRTTAYLLNFVRDLSEIRKLYQVIRKAKIVVCGCGGIGSNLTILLAGLGFKHFLLIDKDKIEKSNLNRQTIFSLSDIGKSKLHVLRRELKKRFPDCRLTLIEQSIDASDLNKLAGKSNFIVISADNPPNLFSIAQNVLSRKDVPLMAAGYSMGVGKIFLVQGSKLRLDKLTWYSPPLEIASSAGPLNYEVAALASVIILKYYLNDLNVKSMRYEWDSFALPRAQIKW